MVDRAALSAAGLRRELAARNVERAEMLVHERSAGSVPSIVYARDEGAVGHGNFLASSYGRIVADPQWRRRLEKAYTASARLPRQHDRRRGELECAASSDALLMNVFCYPGATARLELCRLLGFEAGVRPSFGVRVHVPLKNGAADRSEADMQLGETMVEAKLTESGFQAARAALVERYRDLDEVFVVDALPRRGELFAEYQLLRGVLAAHARGGRFLLLCDARRTDLRESWFRVLCAVRCVELRSRLRIATWQEIGATMPRTVRCFLEQKYGISG